MRTLLCFLFVVLAWSPAPSGGQQVAAASPGPAQSLAAAARAFDRNDLPAAHRAELLPIYARLQTSAAALEQKVGRQPVPAAYARSLKALTDAIKSAPALGRTAPDRMLALCKAVDADLTLKVSLLNDRGMAAVKDTAVSARTVQNDSEVGGCEVWYVPEALEGNEAGYSRFSVLSSPATEKLAAGYYKMWTVKNGQKGKMDRITINSPGAAQQVDLQAPAP